MAARLTDYAHEGACVIPAPQLGAIADGAEMTRARVTGCMAALHAAGWLVPAAGPDQHGQPFLRLCDPRSER